MWWFTKRKLKKEIEQKREIEDQKKRNKILEEELKVITEKMTSTLCPINNLENCTTSCVHFRHGFVSWWSFPYNPYFYTPSVSYIERPKCRLWG